MECHDARILLSFAHRRAEELDAAERAHLQQHLEKCPDCAALAQAERQTDEAFGKVMVDVPVPTDLKRKITARLAVTGPRKPWILAAAAAAMILIAISGTLVWLQFQRPVVGFGDIEDAVHNWDANTVRDYLKSQGLTAEGPESLDYRYLQHVDVVEFKGRRVGKLMFARNDRAASATVLILPKSEFRMDTEKELYAQEVPHTTSISIRHASNFVHVIFFRGDIRALEHSYR